MNAYQKVNSFAEDMVRKGSYSFNDLTVEQKNEFTDLLIEMLPSWKQDLLFDAQYKTFDDWMKAFRKYLRTGNSKRFAKIAAENAAKYFEDKINSLLHDAYIEIDPEGEVARNRSELQADLYDYNLQRA